MRRYIALLCVVILSGALRAGVADGDSGQFRLESPDLPANRFIDARHIAKDYGCHGQEKSPSLQWSGAPAATRSFAITMYDPARPPVSGWWHWIVYDLPPSTHMLPRQAGEAGGALLPVGAKQALPDGDAPQARYYGPCPDAGDPAHHYVITVYALSVDRLDVSAAATPAAVDYMVESKSLGKASIVRSFGRPASDQK